MKGQYGFWFFGIVIFLGISIASGGDGDDDCDEAVYDYLYIQEHCTEQRPDIVITPGLGKWKKYGFIMADTDGCYNPNMRCGIHINVSSDHQITLRFQTLATVCNDFVQIIEDNHREYCGFATPPYSLYTSSSWVKVQFNTGPAMTSGECLTGFKLYYTAYHTGECSDEEFRCSIDGRCIPKELKCDKYDNCGDWSDETTGACGLSQGAIIAISVVSALVGLSVLGLICYCLYDRASRRKSTRARENARRSAPPTESTEDRIDTIIGPPEYPEPPPAYTVVNTSYAGVYDDVNDDVPEDPEAPPSYQSVGAAP